jgi:hypothetical protein
MSVQEIFVPIIAIISICTTLFGLYYLRNKENMALIEKGMNPRTSSPEEPRRYAALKYGLMFAGGGLGLAIAFLLERALAKTYQRETPFYGDGPVQFRMQTFTEDFPQLYFAFIIFGAGIGLVSAYLIMRKDLNRK